MDLALLGRVSGGGDLSQAEMESVIDQVMQGQWPAEQIGLLLAGMHAKGETSSEIAGAAEAMRRHMVTVTSRHPRLLDTCGTGGDGSGTFNISTAAAIVTAAAGVPVAKHGNRRITSKSGSADVLAELGVRIDAPLPVVQDCLDRLGLCFCFAPLHHPAMREVAEVRRQLGFPTIFNLLGPLSNPAAAPYQLLGVGKPPLRGRLAEALRLLAPLRSAVVCGDDGLDEVTLDGPTRVSVVTADHIKEQTWRPEDFEIAAGGDESLRAETPSESAAVIRRVLDGESGAPRRIVVLNAAAALWVVGEETELPAAARRAAEAIDSGRASQLLASLSEVSHS